MKGKKIGFKTEEYNRISHFQEQLDREYLQLITKGKEVLGVEKLTDIKAYIDNPKEYLESEFRNLYGLNEPKHISSEAFLASKIKVDFIALNQNKKIINDLSKKMQRFAPTFTKDGLKINFKEADFNQYLNPKKQKEYYALEALVDAAKIVQQDHSGTESIHITRFHKGLIIQNGQFLINPYLYT